MKNSKLEIYILNEKLIKKIMKDETIRPEYDQEFIDYLIKRDNKSSKYVRYYDNNYLKKLFSSEYVDENLIKSGIYEKVDSEKNALYKIIKISEEVTKINDTIDNLVDDIIYDLSNKLADEICERDVRESAEKNISKYNITNKEDEKEIIEKAVEEYQNL